MSLGFSITADLRTQLVGLGFSLHHFFRVSQYNQTAPPGFALPEPNGRRTVGMLVANNFELWPVFISYLRANPHDIDRVDPLDSYTQKSIALSVQQFDGRTQVRFAHQMTPNPIAMQHLSDVCGFAQRSSSHLCIHPKYGPWISLRGVIIFDFLMDIPAIDSNALCDTQCAVRCGKAFTNAIAAMDSAKHEAIRQGWIQWLQIRDLCTIGRQYRYSQPQLEYHYTHNKDILRTEVEKMNAKYDQQIQK